MHSRTVWSRFANCRSIFDILRNLGPNLNSKADKSCFITLCLDSNVHIQEICTNECAYGDTVLYQKLARTIFHVKTITLNTNN